MLVFHTWKQSASSPVAFLLHQEHLDPRTTCSGRNLSALPPCNQEHNYSFDLLKQSDARRPSLLSSHQRRLEQVREGERCQIVVVLIRTTKIWTAADVGVIGPSRPQTEQCPKLRLPRQPNSCILTPRMKLHNCESLTATGITTTKELKHSLVAEHQRAESHQSERGRILQVFLGLLGVQCRCEQLASLGEARS